MTPLHVAAFYGSANVIRYLLQEVSDLDINALDFGSCARSSRPTDRPNGGLLPTSVCVVVAFFDFRMIVFGEIARWEERRVVLLGGRPVLLVE